MNTLLLTAAILSALLGLIHSILGEKLIFLRSDEVFKSKRRIGIICATWHIVSLFGFAIAALLFHYASSDDVLPNLIRYSLIIAMLLSSILVAFQTKGKHPGWIVLGIISVLLFLA